MYFFHTGILYFSVFFHTFMDTTNKKIKLLNAAISFYKHRCLLNCFVLKISFYETKQLRCQLLKYLSTNIGLKRDVNFCIKLYFLGSKLAKNETLKSEGLFMQDWVFRLGCQLDF